METNDIPNYSARKAALIEEIIAAFDGVSRKGGVSMSEAAVIDDYGNAGERYMARQEDKDTRWEEITIEQLENGWGLIFLDAIGFRYYLPACLLYALHQAATTWEEYYNSARFAQHNHSLLIFTLTSEETEDYCSAIFEIFTPAQSRAIAHYLQLDAERTDVILREQAEREAREEAEYQASLPEEEREHLQELRADEWEEFARKPSNKSRYALEKHWSRFL